MKTIIAAGVVAATIVTAGCSASRDASSPSPARPTSSTSELATTDPASRSSQSVADLSAARPTPVKDTPADRRQRSNRLATDALAGIAIKGRAPKTGYDRDRFGSAWTDDNDDPLGHNGCDTRNDILRRDLTAIVVKPNSSGCAVLTGTLRDPYTNAVVRFIRGGSSSSDVQIDHVVALSDAWQKGAQRYDLATRTNIANDPLNLLAVDGPTNAAKGDGDAATWLPPNTAYRCTYVARQIAVKARWQLWMTQAEHDAAARVLGSCPDQTVPAESGEPVIAHAPRPSSSRPPSQSRPSPVYYENCDAVRAAGAAPLYAGQPGYDAHLDRDGDGVACQ